MNREYDDRAYQNWYRWIDTQVNDCPFELTVAVCVAVIALAIKVVAQ
jgi:hypothetical protein